MDISKRVRLPALQVALDDTSWARVKRIVSMLPVSDQVIIEAGTPLIKSEGARVISLIKEVNKKFFVIADLKTLDAADVEVGIAYNAGADGAVVSGLAPEPTIRKFIRSCRENGLVAYIDSLGSYDISSVVRKSSEADVLVIHRGIDEEACGRRLSIEDKLDLVKSYGLKAAVAGGIKLEDAKLMLSRSLKPDIIIVGRDITRSSDPRGRAYEYLRLLEGAAKLQRPP